MDILQLPEVKIENSRGTVYMVREQKPNASGGQSRQYYYCREQHTPDNESGPLGEAVDQFGYHDPSNSTAKKIWGDQKISRVVLPDGQSTRWRYTGKEGDDLEALYGLNRDVEEKEYVVAAKRLLLYYDTLGLLPSIGDATLENSAYYATVTFKRRGQVFGCRFGKGLAYFQVHGSSIRQPQFAHDIIAVKYRYEPIHTVKPPETLCSRIARRYFEPYVVLAAVCEGAVSASEMSVEEWCTEFYENVDSHKGHLSHSKCLSDYFSIRRLVGKDMLEKLAALHRRT